MKVSDLLNSKQYIEELLKKEMGLASAMEVIRFAKDVSGEFAEFEEKRVALVKKFGTQKEDGNFVVEDTSQKEKCQKGIDKLLNKEVKFSGLDKSICDFKTVPSELIRFEFLYN